MMIMVLVLVLTAVLTETETDSRFDSEPLGLDELFPELLQDELLAALLVDAQRAAAPAQSPVCARAACRGRNAWPFHLIHYSKIAKRCHSTEGLETLLSSVRVLF